MLCGRGVFIVIAWLQGKTVTNIFLSLEEKRYTIKQKTF